MPESPYRCEKVIQIRLETIFEKFSVWDEIREKKKPSRQREIILHLLGSDTTFFNNNYIIIPKKPYSTVTLFAKLRGLSTS